MLFNVSINVEFFRLSNLFVENKTIEIPKEHVFLLSLAITN